VTAPFVFEPIAQAFCVGAGYQFIRGVGRGAFKETFEVSLSDGGRAALKVFKPNISPERTRRELEAMTRCAHPNIARLANVTPFELGGAIYTVAIEEFLSGGTLEERMQRGLLRPEEVRELGDHLVSALSHIASHGLVHRDLKPANVLFRADGITPVIVDFGLVRDLGQESLTATHLAMGPGTPLFAPPEQLVNDKAQIDWRSDQFSLGVMLSIVALGRHPYHHDRSEPVEAVIQRVASRGAQAADWAETVKSVGLPVLVPMTRAWPVHRLRTPGDLLERWQHQTGTV
jgi:serine/threonine protein kinase